MIEMCAARGRDWDFFDRIDTMSKITKVGMRGRAVGHVSAMAVSSRCKHL